MSASWRTIRGAGQGIEAALVLSELVIFLVIASSVSDFQKYIPSH